MRTWIGSYCVVLAAIMFPSRVWAQDVIVLKMGSFTSGAYGSSVDGRVTLTLASGTKITVPVTNLDITVTRQLMGAPPATTSSPPEIPLSPSQSEQAITRKCQGEWPDDFRMQAYYDTQQKEALATLQRRAMSSRQQRIIRTKCATEWAGDFRMMNYCEEQPLEALAQLGR
jgi:hypothetical protein